MKQRKLIGRLSEFNHFGEEAREESAFPNTEQSSVNPKSYDFECDETYEQRLVRQNTCRDKQITNGYVCIADYGLEIFCNYKCRKCIYGVRVR